jgi:hypothetical protein
LSAPKKDADLEEAVRCLFTKIRRSVPQLVLIVFVDRGMRLSVCFERQHVKVHQACVWTSAAYGSSLDWLADDYLRDHWMDPASDEPFRVCGSATCLRLSIEEHALDRFGTDRPARDENPNAR